MGKRRGPENGLRAENSGLLVLMAVLLAWEILGRVLELRTGFLPPPSRVILEIYRERHTLVGHALATASEACAGILIAVSLAVSVGIAYASTCQHGKRPARWIAAAPVALLVAAAPLVTVLFGFGMPAKIAFASLLGFLPMFNHTVKACHRAPDDLLQLARLAGARSAGVFWKIRVPEALPGLFAGLRESVVFSLAGAIAAEFIVADRGLGYMLLESCMAMDIPLLFATMSITALLLLTFMAAIYLLHRVLAPWSFDGG